ncbi:MULTISPECIES: hypothetical protein [Nocardiaceae]|uniref:hypothetical protein n=1 Tax=Nocardiaceae TaxID=85025 RepID=UPI00055ECBB2|nr:MULTISPECIES: hypothetical protein [Rhodococcus]OZD12097.1 hypothetical protein CH248_29290 [Rhodococcus sp. 06-156-4a]OZD15766.1 hypothetical protein CH253_22630 [Rhodococcus sp. 06-156-3C]OZD21150.1 hypothetical protein CH280_02860 [Rhodococcus sp. 06-156-4C]OZD32332.1 hypothetical protein CH284_20790 [Rhodococcus sp. 06-156-3]OZD36554.1 hypothetical protein CH247_03215 [Rhodococcus sp. 06-156-3b]
MHEVTTHRRATPGEQAIMAAIATVPTHVRTHALGQVTAYAAQADRAAVDPNASTEAVHREQAAKWACIARENGASEDQITAAYQEGQHPAAA